MSAVHLDGVDYSIPANEHGVDVSVSASSNGIKLHDVFVGEGHVILDTEGKPVPMSMGVGGVFTLLGLDG